MRIAIIDESAARAAVIEEGLREAGLGDVAVFLQRGSLIVSIEAFGPDVILIDIANPRRDELEEMLSVSRALARPVAMFVDQSDTSAMEAAIDAGVSAYVVDGFAKQRIKPVLELAIRRFNAFARLREELDAAKSALAARTSIDAAKALLITRCGLDEPAAYALLRKAAMDSGRKISEIAEALLTADRLMGDL
jgi:response regulator NasT